MLSCFGPLGSMAVSAFAVDRHICGGMQSALHLEQWHLSTKVRPALLQSGTMCLFLPSRSPRSPRDEFLSSGIWTFHRESSGLLSLQLHWLFLHPLECLVFFLWLFTQLKGCFWFGTAVFYLRLGPALSKRNRAIRPVWTQRIHCSVEQGFLAYSAWAEDRGIMRKLQRGWPKQSSIWRFGFPLPAATAASGDAGSGFARVWWWRWGSVNCVQHGFCSTGHIGCVLPPEESYTSGRNASALPSCPTTSFPTPDTSSGESSVVSWGCLHSSCCGLLTSCSCQTSCSSWFRSSVWAVPVLVVLGPLWHAQCWLLVCVPSLSPSCWSESSS